MARVARINVTPVKGTRLATLARATLTAEGIVGNRRFFFVDDRGEHVSCTDRGAMMQVLSELDAESGRVRLTFPSGEVAEESTNELGDRFEARMDGRAVAVAEVAGPVADAMGRFLDMPLRFVRTEREGDGPDVHRLTLVSVASVDELGRRGDHDGVLDPRRFRMNLELAECEPFEEDTWSGRRVRVGNATVDVLGPVPRCRATTLSPETGEKDWDTLTQIARFRPLIAPPDRGIPFGVYAEVRHPGEVAVGDLVKPADT